jgi:hypothetical protein
LIVTEEKNIGSKNIPLTGFVNGTFSNAIGTGGVWAAAHACSLDSSVTRTREVIYILISLFNVETD